jgi:hypothetical protein
MAYLIKCQWWIYGGTLYLSQKESLCCMNHESILAVNGNGLEKTIMSNGDYLIRNTLCIPTVH